MKGQLNSRVGFFRYADVRDSFGQRIKTLMPIPVGTPDNKLWCNVKYPSGVEYVRAGADASVVACSIRIRFREGIDNGMYAEVGGRMHEIDAVLPDERRTFINLACKVVNLKT